MCAIFFSKNIRGKQRILTLEKIDVSCINFTANQVYFIIGTKTEACSIDG